jgi:Ca2+-binding RTX toxin-like protein
MVTMIRSDLDFILKQILIAEADARGEELIGTYIPNSELPWGLRRVDGSNNNLLPGQEQYGAADNPFPRATDPTYTTGSGSLAFGPPVFGPGGAIVPGFEGDPANGVPPGYQAGVNWLNNNQYGPPEANNNPNPRAIQPGDVADADPRVISNLIVDQTPNNPAAVFKALEDAGITDDPATAENETLLAVGAVGAAVDAVKDARAFAAATPAEIAAAQAAYDAAVLALPPAQQDALAAYTAAAAIDLSASATAVEAATGALLAALQTGGSVPYQADFDALANALGAIDAMLGDAEAVATSLSGNPSPELTAALSLITELNDIRAAIEFINLDDGVVSSLETLLARGVESASNELPAAAAALDADIDAELASIVSPILASLTERQQFLLAAHATVTDAETALHTLLTETYGLEIAESLTGDILKATLVVANVAPDEGLSAPFNSWMTLFGQFFDHGLDLVSKGGYGTVYIPLQPDDPLYVPGSATNFMAVTRATLGPDGQPVNQVTPFVDQNQTYTSNASHQFFLREYELRDDGAGNLVPHATGRLLDSNSASGGGLPTWADIKAQALNVLGIELNDFNIHSVPEIVMDAYGNFIPGANGFPQLVRAIDANGVVTAQEASLANPLATADGQVPTGHAFLDDIAHTANPGAGEVADGDTGIGLSDVNGDPVSNTGFYDNELLDAHYITGDGRGNENIGLTAIHHVFHSEHNRQIDLIKNLVVSEAQAAAAALVLDPANAALQANAADTLAFLNEWLDVDLTAAELPAATLTNVVWDGERLFQAAKVPTEMQYQHLVFEEFARKIQPAINVFVDYDATIDPSILAEFAHTVYRFGHSMLTETVDRYDIDWNPIGTNGVAAADATQIGLIEAFLNPLEFAASGIDAAAAAGAIARGMTRQTGNEIDEFVTEALRNNLVGLPLDLAAINIARGRETGVPTLNAARAEFYRGTGDTQIKPYTSWADFTLNIKNPASVINFIAAYGTHASISAATTAEAKRDAATKLVLGDASLTGQALIDFDADRAAFLNATGAYAGGSLGGLNDVDFWIGGLAEKKLIFGGMLGSTFNFVFETQLEALQNGDRFYYLSRLANLNLTAQLENNKFSEVINRNTNTKHLPGDVFSSPNFFLEVDQSAQFNAGLGSADPTNADIGVDPFQSNLNPLVERDVATNRLEYNGAEHVVLGGTESNDILVGGLGDDTLWGDGGDDVLEGGDGNDLIFGGAGDDIVTDLFGVNEIRSGTGNDVISVGPGVNLIITDTGDDVVFGGPDDDEVLAGQGNDFVAGGAGNDFIIGGEGSDWLEANSENGLLLGDNGDLVQGLPLKIGVSNPVGGDDVLLSGSGNADHDAEAGDDIMVAGLGTQKFFGAQGFDWVTHKDDPYGIEADMLARVISPHPLAFSPGSIVDRYLTVEAVAGSSQGDFIRGDERQLLPGVLVDIGAGEGGFADAGDDQLLDFDLIEGLRDWLPDDIIAAGVFDGGNILIGGGGSDVIEGRGGQDLVDGDLWLSVQIEVSPDAARAQTWDTFSIDSIMEIRDRMLTREIMVDQLLIVRALVDGNLAGDIDVAQYRGLRQDYDIEGLGTDDEGVAQDLDGDGFISITHLVRDAAGAIVAGAVGIDGVDRVKNIERLLFSEQTIKITDHANSIAAGEVVVTSSALNGLFNPGAVLTADVSGIADADGVSAPIVITWQIETNVGSNVFEDIVRLVADNPAAVRGPTFTLTNAELGLAIRAIAQFRDGDGVLEQVSSAPEVVTLNVAPVIATTALTLPENATAAGTVVATDANGDPITFAIVGGADAALFAIDAATGLLAFLTAPDFQAPADANGDNIYDVIVQASDGLVAVQQAIAFTVTDVNEAPVITSNAGGPNAAIAIAENTTAVTTVTAVDPDVGAVITFAIVGGADAALFTIDAVTGVLVFAAAPDLEAPADADGDNVYDVIVEASDGLLATQQAIAVTVTNVNEAPVITSNGGGANAAVLINEDTNAVTTVTAVDPDAGAVVTFSIVGGADALAFTINAVTGVLAFVAAPDFEAPTDANGDNVYDVIVEASDGLLAAQQAIAVTVADASEAPVITSNGGGANAAVLIAENTTAVTTVTAADPDAGAVLSFSIAGGADAARFTINAVTGALAFAAAPNFEAPTDVGTDNVYDVIVGVSDGALTAQQAIAVTVADANDAPVGTPAVTASAALSGFTVSLTGVSDQDGLPGVFTTQWQRSTNGGGTWTDIVGATAATYSPATNAAANELVRAVVTYTDLAGFSNSVNSGPSGVLVGTDGANTLTGTALVDLILGLGGDDVLSGVAGADIMIGGAGNDTYAVDSVGDVVVENPNEGTDTVRSSISYTLGASVESLMLVGAAAINGTGNTLNNVIVGNAASNTLSGGGGDDTIQGGGGADTYIGGTGNDVLVVANAGITIVELADEGTDTVLASVTTTLGANVENLVLTGTAAVNGTGNGLANIINGNNARNMIQGNGGDDSINAGGGEDVINGGAGDDTILGGAGDDQIQGGAGNDTLNGGTGNDIMNGGTGNDVFAFAGGFGNDRIVGFDANPVGGQDLIDLRALGVSSANFNAVVSVIDQGNDVLISVGAGGNSILLQNVPNVATVTQDDFILL